MRCRETMESVPAGQEREFVDVSSDDIVKCAEEAQIQAAAELLTHLRKMVNEPTFSDVVFVCKYGDRVHALRKLLAGRSDVLNRMLTNGMAESSLSEIELREIRSEAMLPVLEFLYTGALVDYPIGDWYKACDVTIASRFFLLPNLEKIARKFIHENYSYKRLLNVASLLVAAIGFNASCDETDVNLEELVTGMSAQSLYGLSYVRRFSEEDFHFILGNSKGKSDFAYVRSLSGEAFRYLKEFSNRNPQKCDLNSFKQMILWCRYQSDREVRTRVKMEVCVKTLFGKAITLQVESFNTVDEIKRKIQERMGNPPDQQQLCDSHSQTLEDGLTLAHYGVLNGSTLTVSFSKRRHNQIFVNLPGEHITVQVQGSDTIGTIKKKIEDTVGCPVSKQHLYFDGKQLDDGHTLADYNIKMDSILLLRKRLRGYFVRGRRRVSQIFREGSDGKMDTS